ncbi:family 43 glycosylhydrolase [Celerinatantimonas sp. YJH-8]|uniref:family 43 glycosylhydrolase n=1 Tax=Celerinatantimonas sp. YJH-8 TaxID=3228714 RepID=UPI0038C6A2EC
MKTFPWTMAFFAIVIPTGSWAANQVIDDGIYIIQNRNSQKALEVVNGGADNPTNIIQANVTGTNRQKWRVTYRGDGYYSLVNLAGGGSAEVYNWSADNGANISEWSYAGRDSQLWSVQSQHNGYFTLTNKFSGKVMEVYERSTSNGANISQWEDNGGNWQQWQFRTQNTTTYHWPLSGDIGTHDPTVIHVNNTWYEFNTGNGISRKVSYNGGLSWTNLSALLPNGLSWWTTYVPDNNGLDVWAPDVRKFGDQYYLYYAISTFGSNTSAIGLLSSSDPASDHWSDQGLVIRSNSNTGYNAIDPELVIDENNKPWLAFGSWFDGIKLTRLNATTMKPSGTIYSLARRSGGIEATSITYHNGYYYLFVSVGRCCQGVNSTYQIRYGRATSITGPYLDKDGVDMLNGGGSLFDSGNDHWVGPGGEDIVDNHTIVRHAYDATDNGASKLLISDLNWDDNGWPTY